MKILRLIWDFIIKLLTANRAQEAELKKRREDAKIDQIPMDADDADAAARRLAERMRTGSHSKDPS